MSRYLYIDKPKSLKGSTAFTHYRRVSKPFKFRRRLMCNHTYEYNKVIDEIWRVVSKRLLTNTSGVYLRGIGYLANWMTPSKIKMSKNIDGEVEEFYNHQTDGHFYHTGIFPVNKVNKLKGWDIERGLINDFKREKWRLLKTGHLYKINYKELKKLFFNEKYDY